MRLSALSLFLEIYYILQDHISKTLIEVDDRRNGVIVFKPLHFLPLHAYSANINGLSDLWHIRLGYLSNLVVKFFCHNLLFLCLIMTFIHLVMSTYVQKELEILFLQV